MKYLILPFWMLFLSCSDKKYDPTFINYNKALDSLSLLYSLPQREEHKIDLCALFNKSSWDSIAFIFPYLPERDLDDIYFCNVNEIKDTMRYVVGVEWNFGLLFLKNNCVESYSVVGGNPSFVEIVGKDRPSIPILKRSDCKVKLINVPGEGGRQSFFFIPLNYPMEEELKKLEPLYELPRPIDSLKL
jgi:hypothetical protein